MDVTMEDVVGELEISRCRSITTSPSSCSLDDGMGLYAWKAMSAVADPGAFCSDADRGQDLNGLIESMLCDDGFIGAGDSHPALFPDEPCSSNPSSSTTTTNQGTPVQLDDPHQECNPDPGKGLRLLHLLMAAAEALSGPRKSQELARVILVRLKDMVSATGASNMERLAVHFTDALQGLLDGSHAVARTQPAIAAPDHNTGDVLTAFQMYQDMSPYMKFGYFTTNQAILEAVAGDRRVHIVDYDLAEGIQWASLVQAMTSRPDGVSPPHLRITAVTRCGVAGARAVQGGGPRLAEFAGSIGQPFSFGHCRLDSDEMFRPATVRLTKGETLVANCILHQAAATTTVRRPPPGSVGSFLAGMAALGAKMVTVVEEEEGKAAEGGFVDRFMEELHRYSAVWDSLEAGFPTQSRTRGLVERVILAPNIAGAVSRAYGREMDGEGRPGWGEWMRESGFNAVLLSCFNHSQARLLLGLFNDGYTVEGTKPNKIVLGWKARRLLSASVWAPPPMSSVPSSPADHGAFQFTIAGFSRTECDFIDSFLVEPVCAPV